MHPYACFLLPSEVTGVANLKTRTQLGTKVAFAWTCSVTVTVGVHPLSHLRSVRSSSPHEVPMCSGLSERDLVCVSSTSNAACFVMRTSGSIQRSGTAAPPCCIRATLSRVMGGHQQA